MTKIIDERDHGTQHQYPPHPSTHLDSDHDHRHRLWDSEHPPVSSDEKTGGRDCDAEFVSNGGFRQIDYAAFFFSLSAMAYGVYLHATKSNKPD